MAGSSNSEALIAMARPGVEIVRLDPNQDGFQQINDFLADRSNIDAIHIVGHGDPGVVKLGTAFLDSANLNDYANELSNLGQALTQDGDILLYGCRIAGTAEGQDLVQRIAALTGADVQASMDDTGAARSGGDWDLEYQVGSISAQSGFDDVKVAGYDYRLASLNAGDLVFLGLNADDTNPDTFAMVATVDIPTGTTVYITDYSVFSNGNFQTTGSAAGTEGVLTWTTTSTVSAGTILAQTLTGISGTRTGVDDFGTVSTSGWTTNSSFSPGGDQLIIFQGTNATTAAGATWIYAFSNQQIGTGIAPVSANGQWLTVAGAITIPVSPLLQQRDRVPASSRRAFHPPYLWP